MQPVDEEMLTISDLVGKLKSNEKVLALIEYGSARYDVEPVIGDYDICVLIESSPMPVESIHFRLREVPVDMNIRTISELEKVSQVEGFESALFRGRIIYAANREVLRKIQSLEHIQRGHRISTQEKQKIRHGHRHIIDKVIHRKESEPFLCQYLLDQGMYYLVKQYFDLRKLSYEGDRKAFEYFKTHDIEMYREIAKYYEADKIVERLEKLGNVAEIALEPIGGMWKDDELIVFGDENVGESIYQELVINE